MASSPILPKEQPEVAPAAFCPAARHNGFNSLLTIRRYERRGFNRSTKSEKVEALKGRGFSRAANSAKSEWALAPEGMQVYAREFVERFSSQKIIPDTVSQNLVPKS